MTTMDAPRFMKKLALHALAALALSVAACGSDGGTKPEGFEGSCRTCIGDQPQGPNESKEACEAFAEDSWRRIRIGEVEFEVAKPCSRCVMPSIDQATAHKDGEILRVLAGYRRGDDRQTYFGQNLLYTGSGGLALGDTVEVLEAG